MDAAVAQDQGGRLSTDILINLARRLHEDIVLSIQEFDLELQIEFLHILSAMSLMSALSVRLETVAEKKFGKRMTDIFHLLQRDRSSYRECINHFWEIYEETCRECGAPEILIETIRKHRQIIAA